MGCLNSKNTEDVDGQSNGTKEGKKVAKAGAKGGAKLAKRTLEHLEYKEFKNLGLPEIDAWFEAVGNNVVDLGEACDTASEGVLRLLEAQEIIDDGVEDKSVKAVAVYLAKTVKAKGGTVSISSGKLVVTSAEGCGAGWLIFDGVSKLVDALHTFVEEVPQVYPNIEQAVEESKDLPAKIESGAQSNPLKAPGIIKNGSHNIKVLGGIPAALKESVSNCHELLKTLKEAFEAQQD